MGLLLGEDVGDGTGVVSGPAALVGHLVAPEPGLTVALGQRGKGAARPEGIAHIADRSFHAALLIAGAYLTRARCEVVVRTEFDQAGMKMDLIAAAFQDSTLEVVVEKHARLAGPIGKGMHVAAQEILHGLIEEELQIQRSGIRQSHDEAGQCSSGAAHHHVSKVGPIDLRLD